MPKAAELAPRASREPPAWARQVPRLRALRQPVSPEAWLQREAVPKPREAFLLPACLHRAAEVLEV